MEKDESEELGLEFEKNTAIRTCRNGCATNGKPLQKITSFHGLDFTTTPLSEASTSFGNGASGEC